MYTIKVYEYEAQNEKYRHLRTELRDVNRVKEILATRTVKQHVEQFYKLEVYGRNTEPIEVVFTINPYIFD